MIGKLKKDSAPYTHHCSGEGREKREGKSLCGGNHITSLLYLREERKEVLTHSCKGILHLHRYGSGPNGGEIELSFLISWPNIETNVDKLTTSVAIPELRHCSASGPHPTSASMVQPPPTTSVYVSDSVAPTPPNRLIFVAC